MERKRLSFCSGLSFVDPSRPIIIVLSSLLSLIVKPKPRSTFYSASCGRFETDKKCYIVVWKIIWRGNSNSRLLFFA